LTAFRAQTDGVVSDFETSGLDAESGEVIAILAVSTGAIGGREQRFSLLLRPSKWTSDQAEEPTGISDAMHAVQPTFREVAPAFMRFADNTIKAALNNPA
jgi:DNA polymerase III epsilon subunit-like protein